MAKFQRGGKGDDLLVCFEQKHSSSSESEIGCFLLKHRVSALSWNFLHESWPDLLLVAEGKNVNSLGFHIVSIQCHIASIAKGNN